MAHDHLAEMLDLDAEVLRDYFHELITWVGTLAPDRPRVVDLGAGSGTGTIALARELPGATITAVDSDTGMLDRLRAKVIAEGHGDRVRTVEADLDAAWPDELAPADLLWASASMHHMADPGGALAQAFRTLVPGGVFVIAELQGFPRFLTGNDLEDRVHRAQDAMRAEHGLHMHEDWGARLAEAGFTPEAERRFDIALRPPLPPAAGRYAQVTFARLRHALEGRLDATELAELETLAATVATRDDLTVTTTRTVWVARR